MEDNNNNRARLAILDLANMISVPMSLTAIIRLRIPDTLSHHHHTPLTASQLLSLINPSSSSPPDPENLQRILRLLASYKIFREHIDPSTSTRSYSLTPVGQTLVTDPDGLSYGDFVLQHHQEAMMRAWTLLHEAVLEPETEPFVKANGESAYEYYVKQPEMNELMLRAMSGISVPFMRAILDSYDGLFLGVRTLVDVGGSRGDCLRVILQKCPWVEVGINFDLPGVVAKAPQIAGVTHVGGDMFKSIPSADAIFMRWIMTTWSDDECRLIMENCYKALPTGGRLIACESVLPRESDGNHCTRALLEADIYVMTVYRAKGKHRTEDEFKQLGMSAGFRHLKAFYFDHFHTILEFHK